jgi:hypothetical protein
MKIRHGFVSNSSSTSFGLYGVYIADEEKLIGQLLGEPKVTKNPGCPHEFNRETIKFCPECGKQAWDIMVEKRDLETVIEKYLKENNVGLDLEQWNSGDSIHCGFYIGINLKQLGDVKDKIKILQDADKKLRDMFPNKEPRFYIDGGFDG